MGEEFLYREAGKGRFKQADHLLATAEAWAALRKGAQAVGIEVEDELPKQFESSHGTTEPDLVFSLCARNEPKKFYTWEVFVYSALHVGELESIT